MSGFAGLISIIVLLAGGTFGVVEYLDRKSSARAAETLHMIEVWETRGAGMAFQALSNELVKARKNVPQGQIADDARRAILVDNLTRRAIRNLPDGHYEKIVQFFTRLSLCIQAELCSEEVAAKFFADTLYGFQEWSVGEINRRRMDIPDYAVELDRLELRFKAL